MHLIARNSLPNRSAGNETHVKNSWCASRFNSKHHAVSAFLLALCLLAAGLSLSPFFAQHAHAAQGSLDYGVYVGSTLVTPGNAQDVLHDGGSVSYIAATRTLVLRDANITSARSWKTPDGRVSAGIDSETDTALTIQLIGDNKITVPYLSDRDVSYGILAASDHSGKVVLRGDGSLTVKSAKAQGWSMGIFAVSMVVRDQAHVTATAAKAGHGSYGVYTRSTATLKGSSQLIAQGKTAAFSKAPKFGGAYTPKVKAGSSESAITVNKKSPKASMYTSNKYVEIINANATDKTPATMQITTLQPLPCGLSAKWPTLPTSCTGYEIQISPNSEFAPPEVITSHVAPSPTVNGFDTNALKPSTKYYVRVRGINETGATVYAGQWSPTKSVTTI